MRKKRTPEYRKSDVPYTATRPYRRPVILEGGHPAQGRRRTSRQARGDR